MSADTLRIRVKVDSNTGELIVTRKEFDKLGNSVKTADKHATDYAKTIVRYTQAAASIYVVKQAFDTLIHTTEQFVSTAAKFEQLNTSLETVTGSSYAAEAAMEWITKFSADTPYNLDKVTESFISLKSYGLEPTNGLLRTLGDTSSAMSKPLQQAVEAMADAVTGENERLKEFGIRASVTGDEIKYSWMNASGEARSAIIQNNSEVIQSTLEAIFNSKYAGAMQKQSETLNGLMSNLEDQWTIFQKNIMDGGVFEYLKAIVMVVGDYLNEAFNSSENSGKDMALVLIDGFKGALEGLGIFYDQMTLVGDFFDVLGNIGAMAFHGIESIMFGVGDGITSFFEAVINNVVDGINTILEYVNSTGLMEFSYIGKVDLGSDTFDALFKQAVADADQATKDVASSWDKYLSDVRKYNAGESDGQKFVADFISKIDATYAKLQTQDNTVADKTDFGRADDMLNNISNTTDLVESVKDNIYQPVVDASENLQNVSDTTAETINNISDSFTDLQDTLQTTTGDDDIYTVVNNVNDSFNDLSDSSTNLTQNIGTVTDALDEFIFAFSDTFLGTIESNISVLESVYATSGTNPNMSYQDALSAALYEQIALIANPLDVEAGNNFKEAYVQFTQSAQTYLGDMSNFATASEYNFAKLAIEAQTGSFQTTAQNTVSVLDSMNTFLGSINQAFADGILSDEEKATIAGVADNVNANNDVLLGNVNSSIWAQEYYNNTGLATELGTNSVEQAVAKLMGSSSSGVSIASITDTLPELAVDTGLDVSDLANIKANTSETTSAVYGTSIKGSDVQTLDNLRIYRVITSYSGWGYPGSSDYQAGTNVSNTGETTTYQYYQTGGYTGDGAVDAIAGYVHGQEYVVNAQTTKDLGLNDGNGGVFKEMLNELRALRIKTDTQERRIEAMAISLQEQTNLTKRSLIEGSIA